MSNLPESWPESDPLVFPSEPQLRPRPLWESAEDRRVRELENTMAIKAYRESLTSLVHRLRYQNRKQEAEEVMRHISDVVDEARRTAGDDPFKAELIGGIVSALTDSYRRGIGR